MGSSPRAGTGGDLRGGGQASTLCRPNGNLRRGPMRGARTERRGPTLSASTYRSNPTAFSVVSLAGIDLTTVNVTAHSETASPEVAKR